MEEQYRGARKWSRNAQAVATVVWISFLAASVATMLFFALFDPVELFATVGIDIGSQSGYALGFFSLWLVRYQSRDKAQSRDTDPDSQKRVDSSPEAPLTNAHQVQ